ncbi:toprim domain-containing protein [Sphingobium sp. SA2]|uniref:DUF7146 domain-containing protein n=1 Tax=Sphingobium sp. SA2 TaxID=1524832 RepID=UPI0028C160E9|nr:toprim domain-containing protein [Sphingobium sp. SA2]MDT7535488.1 toprim domain-containing protein [Sphingobium sp. SA2]
MTISSLGLAAARLVHRLGGKWQTHGAMCHCPAHDDRIPSLSIRVGHSSLLFKCFAGCDTLDVLRAIRRLDLRVPVERSAAFDMARAIAPRTGELARSLWNCGHGLADTPGDIYLRARGIDACSQALRWHPRTPLGRGRDVQFRPALLAGIEAQERIVAVQRLFLERDGRALAHDLSRPKRTLGRPLCGAVRLCEAGPRLGLAEGIESAQSASILLGLPVWAVLGAERLHQIRVPPAVEEILLLPDYDAAGQRAERLARATYLSQGFAVETLWPWRGHNDWNDVLREGGREKVSRARIAV